MTEAGTLDRTALSWKHATDGMQLIVIGVFLTLTTQGILPWSFWMEAVALWPVLLVGAGLRLIFERSRMPWVMLLSPVLIAAALVWLARGGQPAHVNGPWVAREAAMPADVSSWKLQAKGFMGRVDVQARPLEDGLLARGMSSSREGNERVEVRKREDRAEVILRNGESWGWVGGSSRRHSWKLDVSPDLPMSLEVGGAGGTGQIDLGRGQLSGAKVEGAVNNMELQLPVPKEPTTLRVEGIFNTVRLLVPPGVPVRTRTDGLLNAVDPPASGQGPEYIVRVDGIGNAVTIVEAPAPR
jgi:hypothetical protein